MEVTEIRVHLRSEERLKAFATVTFDDVFVVHNMKVIEGDGKLIVCMPSRKIKDGSYKDVAHPISNEFRGRLEEIVLKAYEEELARNTTPAGKNREPVTV